MLLIVFNVLFVAQLGVSEVHFNSLEVENRIDAIIRHSQAVSSSMWDEIVERTRRARSQRDESEVESLRMDYQKRQQGEICPAQYNIKEQLGHAIYQNCGINDIRRECQPLETPTRALNNLKNEAREKIRDTVNRFEHSVRKLSTSELSQIKEDLENLSRRLEQALVQSADHYRRPCKEAVEVLRGSNCSNAYDQVINENVILALGDNCSEETIEEQKNEFISFMQTDSRSPKVIFANNRETYVELRRLEAKVASLIFRMDELRESINGYLKILKASELTAMHQSEGSS